MCMQCGCPMSFMSGMQGIPPFPPPMPMGAMSPSPMGAISPDVSMPTPEDVQLFQLRFQLQQLKYMRQQIEQSLEFVLKSTAEAETAIKKLEKGKPQKKA